MHNWIVNLAVTGVAKSENRKGIRQGLENFMSDWLFGGY